METNLKLNVAVIVNNPTISSLLDPLIKKQGDVGNVNIFENEELLYESFSNELSNSLFIDIFSIGVPTGLKIISTIRKKYSFAPICLVGRYDDFMKFSDVPENWKIRFEHYYKLTINQDIDSILFHIEKLTKILYGYLIARIAKVQLRHLREIFTSDNLVKQNDQYQANEILEMIEKALENKTKEPVRPCIIPGFGMDDIQKLVNETLEKTSKSIKGYSVLNKLVVYFGLVFILSSFIVTIITSDFKYMTFGGIGLAGIISSFISNPIKAVGSSVSHFIQCQISYVGFLKQIDILNLITPNSFEESIQKSKRLEEVTKSLQESLEKK
jgi:hypothetical protein